MMPTSRGPARPAKCAHLSSLRAEPDPNPGRTEKLCDFLAAASKGRFDWSAVAERSLNIYPVERLQGALKASPR
jgi:hypothetical protein